MTVPYRALGKVRNIFAATGLEITYAYDDLVFSDKSVFIVRFDNQIDSVLHLYFNNDCDKTEVKKFENELINASKTEGFTMGTIGSFSMDQIEGSEELSISFHEKNQKIGN
jgi:hypothetical protein